MTVPESILITTAELREFIRNSSVWDEGPVGFAIYDALERICLQPTDTRQSITIHVMPPEPK